MIQKHKCIRQDCEELTPCWFCVKHYLEKEARYGWYDLKTNNKGFRKWAVKRIFNYYKYLIYEKHWF